MSVRDWIGGGLASLGVGLGLAVPLPAQAQGVDLGRVFERAARSAVRDVLLGPDASAPGRSVPGQAPPPGQPVPGQPGMPLPSQPGLPGPGQPASGVPAPGQTRAPIPGVPNAGYPNPYAGQPGLPAPGGAGSPGQPAPPAPGYPGSVRQPARPPGGYPGQPSVPYPGFPGLPGMTPPPAPGPVTAQRSEPYPIKTADGWTLVVHRYRGPRAPQPGLPPIVLCHGLTYNATFWDLDPAASPARYFAEQGYDVWLADLRGSGMSTKWVWKLDQSPDLLVGEAIRRLSKGKLAPTGYATIDPKAANWTLDQHIAYDVPAIVSLVRQQTGAPEVIWFGHSMGGIVALGHLARHGNPGIGRLITVGSQVTMPNGQLVLQFLREMIGVRTEQLTGQLSGAELMNQTRTSVHNMFFNQSNVAPRIYEALGSWATDVPAMGVMQQYMTLGSTGELYDSTKQFNYARAMRNVTVPILISCGADDQFAPPTVQQYLHANVGSTDKTLLVFGRRSGFAVDSGHDDALVGLNSRAQVYPLIDRWIRGERFRVAGGP